MDETNRITDIGTDEWPYSPRFQDFANFLGLPAERDARGINWQHDEKTAKRIEELYAWGKAKTNSDNPLEIKLAVKDLQHHLGVNWQGKTLVDYMWQHLRIQAERKQADQEAKLLKQDTQVERKPVSKPKTALNTGTIQKQIQQVTQPIQKQIQKQTEDAIRQAVQGAIQAGIKGVFR